MISNELMGKYKSLFLALILSVVFFLILFLTLKDYGISWDETLHFRRGQAYLYYFLTRETTYQKLPELNLQGTNGNPNIIKLPRRSFYQNDLHNGDYMLKDDSGHPPINGELAALSNYVFFQKLGILDDISAHHLFNILSATLLAFVVTYFTAIYLGFFPAIVSFLSLLTYPLFFAEAHFNVKDPPETAFFAATILSFILSIERKNPWWVLVSALFFGLGLGTKFNILFVPVIIIPYLIYRFSLLHNKKDLTKIVSKEYLIALLVSPVIIFMIFYFTWPYLWQDPKNILNILGYYKDIGTGTDYQSENFYLGGFNFFPILWIVYTTPPITLVFFVIGLFAIWKNRKRFEGIAILWLIWLLVPILRVMLPGTVIYGGIRQILEFLPAMILIVGLGVWQIINWTKLLTQNKRLIMIVYMVIITSWLWPFYTLIHLHPHENVYFNFLIGGLRGAKEMDYPSWGNSFGNAYKEGIEWINSNAPLNSKVALLQGTSANAPLIWFRKDIDYKKENWSGFERKEEYLMELTFNDTGKSFNFAWEYIDKFLNPVYELKVDGVPILKIWKNDLIHTKAEMRKNKLMYLGNINLKTEKNALIISLDKVYSLIGVKVNLPSDLCSDIKVCFLEISKDGQNWDRQKDQIPFPQIMNKSNLIDNKINYHIANKEGKKIRIIFSEDIYTDFNKSDIIISILE